MCYFIRKNEVSVVLSGSFSRLGKLMFVPLAPTGYRSGDARRRRSGEERSSQSAGGRPPSVIYIESVLEFRAFVFPLL